MARTHRHTEPTLRKAESCKRLWTTNENYPFSAAAPEQRVHRPTPSPAHTPPRRHTSCCSCSKTQSAPASLCPPAPCASSGRRLTRSSRSSERGGLPLPRHHRYLIEPAKLVHGHVTLALLLRHGPHLHHGVLVPVEHQLPDCLVHEQLGLRRRRRRRRGFHGGSGRSPRWWRACRRYRRTSGNYLWQG